MPYINYCKQCGTPVRRDGGQWVHYRDLDHIPQPVTVRVMSPADSINEAVSRDKVSVDNILRVAMACVSSRRDDETQYDLLAILLADQAVTIQFMLDATIGDRYKLECMFVLNALASEAMVVDLYRAMWRSDDLPSMLRSRLEWLHDVRHIPIKTPTDKLLDTQGW